MSSGISGDMAVRGVTPFAGPASLADAELRPGQHLAGRVIETLPTGDVLVGFGQSRAVVSTSEPLRAGDRVALEVVAGGAKPELRMLTDIKAGPPPAGAVNGENPAAGQRVLARVLEMLPTGDALVGFGHSQAVVQMTDSLQLGQRVVLEVVTGGPKPEFRIVTDNAAASAHSAAAVKGGDGTAGQRVTAHVLEILPNGNVLLQFGQSRASVRTSNPLQPGERVILEIVTGGPHPEFRIVTENPAARPPPAAGQRVTARVLEMLPSGDVLLQVGQNRAVVRTSHPLQPGERVALEAVTGGPKSEFRIVPDRWAADPQTAHPVEGETPPAVLRIAARVLGTLPGGDVVVEFGQSRALVRTNNPRQAGDRVVLEVVTVGARPEVRIVTGSTTSGPPALGAVAGEHAAAGQRLAARVLEMLPSGDVLLEFGQNRAAVRTSTPLNPGDRVVLEVVAGGPKPELRIVTDAAASRQSAAAVDGDTTATQPSSLDVLRPPPPLSARDLPIIMRALADVPAAGVPIADSRQEFLRAAAASDLHPVVVDQIQRLLAPLEAALPTAALAGMIRTFLAQSGLFTENHLSEALKNGTGSLTANHPPAISDVRLLLGELTTPGQPVPDAVRSFGEALLQQQLAVADRLAATGVGQIAVPFMFGDTRVDVVFEWERKARGGQEDRPNGAMSLGIFVHLKALGPIEARLEWQPESLAVTFYVEREATRAIVEAGLDDFSKHLALSGCPAVTSHVWLNPDRMSNASVAPTGSVRGGTILDVMA